jgi:hypothetical protein
LSDIERVIVEMSPPRDGSPGEVAFGYYTLEGNKLALTDEHGKPLRRSSGVTVTHTLREGDNPQSIAVVLTRGMLTERVGQSNFNRPLNYPVSGLA